jgi:hypothetical protein
MWNFTERAGCDRRIWKKGIEKLGCDGLSTSLRPPASQNCPIINLMSRLATRRCDRSLVLVHRTRIQLGAAGVIPILERLEATADVRGDWTPMLTGGCASMELLDYPLQILAASWVRSLHSLPRFIDRLREACSTWGCPLIM